MSKNYYEVLGVPKEASSQDIKKAFRQIARECHPDVSGGDPEAEERFKTARVAYETLMDPVTRARYDRRGERRAQMGPKGGSFFDAFYRATGEGRGGPTESGPTRRHARPKRNDPRNNIGLDDLFNVGEFGFGGSRPGRQPGAPPPRTRPTTGSDVEIELDVPSDVAARGGSVTAVYHRLQRSENWRAGTDDPGLVRVQDIADIRIVPGTRQGTLLRERGLGDAGAFGGAYGDLVVAVRLVAGRPAPRPAPPPPQAAPQPPPAKPSAGDTQQQEVPLDISVVEALLGGRVTLDTPQGTVRLTIPPGTSGGTRLRLRGKGSGGGDLYAVVRIVVPKNLDDESRRLVEAFAALNP